ncbi:alpha/beta fold hydrolase [Nocardioides sp.]|uniref:alpha/beta fold hydrolase n=1 Tax=Nocardioides sp. TaxID=35761 RepID=UPI003517E4FB
MSPADLLRRPPDRIVDVAHGGVAVRSFGTGPDVLLVHGWPLTGATWRHLLPHLVPHVRCHVIDLVGAGDSRFDRTSRIDLDTHAASLPTVLDALGLTAPGSVAVVAHDSGGLMARLGLADDPRVRAWGLIDTEQPPAPSLRFRMFVAIRWVPRFEGPLSRAVTTPALRRHPLLLGGAFRDRSLLDGEFADLFLQPFRTDPEKRWAMGQFARNFDVGAFARLVDVHARMTAPVRLVWGAHDPFFPVARARAMLAGFGGPASLEVIEDGALLVHEERPAEVAAALLPVIG